MEGMEGEEGNKREWKRKEGRRDGRLGEGKVVEGTYVYLYIFY